MEEANSFRKRNEIGDKIEWQVSKVNSLIDLYESHPLLYNNRLKKYHNIHLKTTH
jgi:hypothetical protein